jgi:hypothetical protein
VCTYPPVFSDAKQHCQDFDLSPTELDWTGMGGQLHNYASQICIFPTILLQELDWSRGRGQSPHDIGRHCHCLSCFPRSGLTGVGVGASYLITPSRNLLCLHTFQLVRTRVGEGACYLIPPSRNLISLPSSKILICTGVGVGGQLPDYSIQDSPLSTLYRFRSGQGLG